MGQRGAGWLWALLVPLASPTTAQEPALSTPVATVTPIESEITIDGVLDEPAWTAAPAIGDLVQRQPLPGLPPTERTRVTLLRDKDNLYIGIVAYDSEPRQIIGTQMERDAGLGSDDRIEILLDTFRDQRSAFYFATNPAGAFVDGLTFGDAQLNTEWDSIWRVRTRRTAEGWVAEFAIPFRSLTFPAGSDMWGFNVSRSILRKLEDDRWSAARLDTRFLQVSEAGRITNLGSPTQGKGVDFRPFLAGSWLHLGASGDDQGRRRPGFNVFYNITPNLKVTGTLNTDFGETEVDARQINLQRFSVLFPERRAFFLEGAGVFNFPSAGPTPAGGVPAAGADVFPFFSRRIGLLGGQEVPLDAGVKLTGTVGRNDVGMLGVRTSQLPGVVEGKGYFVGRFKRNLFRQSYVGAIVTNGNTAAGLSGQTYGADLSLATSRLLGGSRNLVVTAYGARSVAPNLPDRNWSYGYAVEYPNDRFAGQVAVREIQANFNPALGFVQRSNVRMLRVAGSWNPRPKRYIQQMFHDVYYTRFTRLDYGLVESWNLYATLLDWHFKSGDSTHAILDFNPTYERVFEPFEISPGVVLPPGEYRFTRFRTSPIATAPKRRLSGSAALVFGKYWSGTAEQVTTGVTYKVPPWFTASFNTNTTWAHLPQGNFVARIVTANVDYSASPTLSFSNLVQYDNRSRNLGWQSRMRWTQRPGNDLFISFNQGWIREEGEADNVRYRVQDTKLAGKFQYAVRF
jgi:hypothetical protein